MNIAPAFGRAAAVSNAGSPPALAAHDLAAPCLTERDVVRRPVQLARAWHSVRKTAGAFYRLAALRSAGAQLRCDIGASLSSAVAVAAVAALSFRRRGRGRGHRRRSRLSGARGFCDTVRGLVRRHAVPIVQLLPPDTDWLEVAMPDVELEAVVADLGDLDRCMDLVAEVFKVSEGEYAGVRRGLSARLGGYSSLVGPEALAPRRSLRRPAPLGSAKRPVPEGGIVLALEPRGTSSVTPSSTGGDQLTQCTTPLAALIDISLWPNDGRVRAPGARSKDGVPSVPYMLNLCVAPAYRRRGLARALLQLAERVVRDAWGDAELYLHVEDDKLPANTLYGATGYEELSYEFDPEMPYSKAEAAVLRDVTWRRKELGPAVPLVLPPEEPVAEAADMVEDEDTEDEFEEETHQADELAAPESEAQPDHGDSENGTKETEEEEDFDWVTSLIK